MKNKAFVDTNLLVYAQDRSAGDKQLQSRALIAELAQTGMGAISTQVMQEFYVAATRKLRVEPLAAKAVLKSLAVFEIVNASPALIYDAIDCSVLDRISFWDALLLAAAASAGCSTLYTEDLQAGQTLLGVTVRNPLA